MSAEKSKRVVAFEVRASLGNALEARPRTEIENPSMRRQYRDARPQYGLEPDQSIYRSLHERKEFRRMHFSSQEKLLTS